LCFGEIKIVAMFGHQLHRESLLRQSDLHE
jgi:hypothetical protein